MATSPDPIVLVHLVAVAGIVMPTDVVRLSARMERTAGARGAPAPPNPDAGKPPGGALRFDSYNFLGSGPSVFPFE